MTNAGATTRTDPFFDDGLTLEELVFQAVGAASMCWEYPEKAGVFDSDRAKAIAEELLERLSATSHTDAGGES